MKLYCLFVVSVLLFVWHPQTVGRAVEVLATAVRAWL
jgi:hypothetical protein